MRKLQNIHLTASNDDVRNYLICLIFDNEKQFTKFEFVFY